MKDNDIRVAMANCDFFIQQFDRDGSVLECVNDLMEATGFLGRVIGLNADRKLPWVEDWKKTTQDVLVAKLFQFEEMVQELVEES